MRVARLGQKIGQKTAFRLRLHFGPASGLRRLWWQAQGARFGRGTRVPPMEMSWPHQVAIGRRCLLETGLFFKFDGFWEPGPSICIGDRVFLGRGCEFNIRSRIEIGHDCLIASGCKFIDHDHTMEVGTMPMNRQPCPAAPIVLEEDVWLGVNVVVLQGVTLSRGSVVGAGAIVTKSVPAYEIWAGVPARKIGERDRSRRHDAECLRA